MLEPRTIPEDLIEEIEENILKAAQMAEQANSLHDTLLKIARSFAEARRINERNIDVEYREWQKEQSKEYYGNV